MPFAWVGAAAAVASAATGVVGAISKGSKQSSDISSAASTATADLAPYSDAGTKATTQTSDLLGLNGQTAADTAMSSFQSSPGYEYNVKQALRGVDAGAASTGILRSGATIKAEEEKASNLADNNFSSYIGRLNSLSTTGESAAANQAGTATSAGTAQANIDGSTSTDVSKSLSGLAGNKSVQNALTDYFGSSSSSGSGTDKTIYNSNVQGGSYQSSTNPDANF